MFYRLLSAIFDDPGFEFGLGQGEKRLHVMFVLQEFHLSQVDARRCRDKVDPKKHRVYEIYQTYNLTLTFSFSYEKQNVKGS